jgi:hypothetical protein
MPKIPPDNKEDIDCLGKDQGTRPCLDCEGKD